MPSALEGQSLYHWTSGKLDMSLFKNLLSPQAYYYLVKKIVDQWR